LPNIHIPTDRSAMSPRVGDEKPVPKPPWLKVRLPTHGNFFQVSDLLKKKRLHTICQSAKCPNIAACWSAKTATFLMLGDRCTRSCAFCAVAKGTPLPPLTEEPHLVADAVASLELDYAVITSVTRDDLADGGASFFAAVVKAIKEKRPRARVEVLIPDFQAHVRALETVIKAGPDVLNHNLETTEPRYPLINRPAENYRRSLNLLKRAKEMGALTKSGLMVGLGEDEPEIDRTLSDLRSVGCDLLTMGQYLRPSSANIPVKKYYTPQEFENFKIRALDLGFRGVEAGPLVRSSYEARKMFDSLQRGAATGSCAI
jgi:lipoic acid synthetase